MEPVSGLVSTDRTRLELQLFAEWSSLHNPSGECRTLNNDVDQGHHKDIIIVAGSGQSIGHWDPYNSLLANVAQTSNCIPQFDCIQMSSKVSEGLCHGNQKLITQAKNYKQEISLDTHL